MASHGRRTLPPPARLFFLPAGLPIGSVMRPMWLLLSAPCAPKNSPGAQEYPRYPRIAFAPPFLQETERLEQRALSSGMPWSIEMLNAKLKACRESGDPDAALRCYATAAAAHNAFPDNVTVKLLLDTCGRAGRLTEALLIYEAAEQAGFVPDPLTVNSLIRHYCATNQAARAFEVYEAAGKRGAPSPNLLTLTALSESCSVASAAARTADGRKMWMSRSLSLYTAGQALLSERSSLNYEGSPPRG